MVKNPTVNAGDAGLQVQSLIWKDSLKKEKQPTPVILPEKSHGQRSLVGYSPWGHKESYMTEHAQMQLQEWGCFLFCFYVKTLKSTTLNFFHL